MKYRYLYQITNLVNNKIYVGVHVTEDLDDGYMGSGKVINRAIQKHGLPNFKKDILEFFESDEAMYAREKEVVTEDFLLRDDVYNLRRGGTGGFDYINKHGLGEPGRIAAKIANRTVNRRKMIEFGRLGGLIAFKGKKHTLQSREKMSQSRKGKRHTHQTIEKMKKSHVGKHSGTKNSNYGTMWITNGTENKKIMKNQEIPDGFKKGRVNCNQWCR